MTIDLGRVLGRTFSITWRHKWLWLLGVFGGGAGFGVGARGGFNVNPFGGSRPGGSSAALADQVSAFLRDYLWLILLAVALILLIALVGFLLACVAVPASIWAALALDAGQPATLGESWRQGMRRFGRYFRLYLLRFLISLAIFAVVGLLAAAGVAIYSTAGKGALLILVPLGVLLVLAWLVVSVVIGFLFIWSERTALILDQGAVESLRSSAWLARRSAGDTLIFAIVMGVIASVLSLVETLVAVVIAVPGIIVLVIGASSGNTVVAVIGVLWIVILAGGLLLVGAGFIGALVQVAYALACRDLCLHHGLAPAGAAPVASAPQSGLPSLPPAPA